MLEHVREQFLADASNVDRVIDLFIRSPLEQVLSFGLTDTFHHEKVFGLAFVQQGEQLRAISRLHTFHLFSGLLLECRSSFALPWLSF